MQDHRRRTLILAAAILLVSPPARGAVTPRGQSPESSSPAAQAETTSFIRDLGDSVSSPPLGADNVEAVVPGQQDRPSRTVGIAPDSSRLLKLTRRMGPDVRIRVSGAFGQTELTSVRVTADGLQGAIVRPDTPDLPQDSLLTIAWPDIRCVEARRRLWGMGALMGSALGLGAGAAPGLGLAFFAANEPAVPSGASGFFEDVGLGLALKWAAVGAVGGCAVGALIGGAIQVWQNLYVSPAISILAVPDELPIRRIALGRIVADRRLTRAHGAVIRAITARLERDGFEVVDPDAVAAVAAEEMDERDARRPAPTPYPAQVLDRLRERTGADAVLSGNVATKGRDAVRCDFQLIHTRTHQVLMTSAFWAGPGISSWGLEQMGRSDLRQPRNLVSEALAHLDALRKESGPGSDAR